MPFSPKTGCTPGFRGRLRLLSVLLRFRASGNHTGIFGRPVRTHNRVAPFSSARRVLPLCPLVVRAHFAAQILVHLALGSYTELAPRLPYLTGEPRLQLWLAHLCSPQLRNEPFSRR